MFNETEARLAELGADITTREIKQQPELWQEAYANYLEKKEDIESFLAAIHEKHDFVRVIFSGAGTSAFVGDTITPYLNEVNDSKKIQFFSYATTDILGSPETYLEKDIPTILVSFARSGNSPESVATVELAAKLVKDLYEITITCAAEGQLAQFAKEDPDNLLLLMPERSNDKGFAMTGSYTCMTLTALLVFDPVADHEAILPRLVDLGEGVFEKEDFIQGILEEGIDRVVYLGANGFFGLSREAQLKILELTAGEIVTLYETPLGFRHGPKSFINEKTAVIVFVSADAYTRQYDVDLLNEVYHDKIAGRTIALTQGEIADVAFDQFVYDVDGEPLPDVYMSLPYVIFAQAFALIAAVKLGNKPDTPSPTGTVNRVVQGVILHDYEEK